ncbi:MAG TPA: hypothetical protein VJ912_00250 [Candidatus Nanoarchaeia archaeon]|nr:hypothetical protein [Candidatus Nanoarchaeia archaeon]
MNKQEKINKILSLNLPKNKYCVYGGFAMELRGIRKADDIDILVKKDLWENLKKKYTFNLTNKGRSIEVGDIEIWKELEPYITNPDKIIDNSKEIQGIKTISLDDLIEFKKAYSREKDLNDIQLIKEYQNKKRGY